MTGPEDPYIGQWWPPGHVLGWEHTFVHEFQDLVEALAAGHQPEPSFDDGFMAQAVAEAIARSARRRGWVTVQEVVAEGRMGGLGVQALSGASSAEDLRAGGGR